MKDGEEGRKSHAPSVARTASDSDSGADEDVDEPSVPEFQRVYISGEDTTGVSFFFKPRFSEIFSPGVLRRSAKCV